MKATTRVAANTGPNRVLVALAAAWIILSLAIGGAVHAETSAQAQPVSPAVAGSSQD